MNPYIAYLDNTIERLKCEEQELIVSERKDEANFIKIKMNICDICKTIYNVVLKSSSDTDRKKRYIGQMTRLEENWQVSLVKAKEHEDVEKIVIEEIKLEMLRMILGKYEELEGE